MKLRELIMILVAVNGFMFLWSTIGMPGTTNNSSFSGPGSYALGLTIGGVIGLLGTLAVVALANYSSLPLPNERSATYAFMGILFGATLGGFLPMINNMIGSLGLQNVGVGVVVDLIILFVGMVFLFTVLQWVLGGEESMK